MKNKLFLSLRKATIPLTGKGLGKIPGIILCYKFIYKTVKPKGIILIDVQGNKMYVDCRDKGVTPFLLTKGVYEKYETVLFKKLIKPGMVVIDIGANIGYYSLIAAKLVGSKSKVYAFEPEPRNYRLLVKNIKINSYNNIIPIQKAASNKQGKTKLFTDKGNLGNPSFSEDNISEKEGFVNVKTITLDEFFENLVIDNNIIFIKIDAQGAEGLILEGAERLLKNNNLIIIMEFWPYGLKNLGTNPTKLLNKLYEYGFKIKHIDEQNQCLKYIEIEKLIEICQNAKQGKASVNILLKK
ncbi:MAG: FkbM family methyltransferase [Candidatus Helarchaeota archaeon]